MERQTKGAGVKRLLERPEGASIGEIMEATGWQRHTVRGFMAGRQLRGMGYRAATIEREDGTRAYAIEPLEQEG